MRCDSTLQDVAAAAKFQIDTLKNDSEKTDSKASRATTQIALYSGQSSLLFSPTSGVTLPAVGPVHHTMPKEHFHYSNRHIWMSVYGMCSCSHQICSLC